MPLHRAPFSTGGSSEVDASLAARLLSVALEKGGDYADLFFEYRSVGHFLYEDDCLKSASRQKSIGLGVRVRKGDAVGSACVDSLEWEAMARAAQTAAAIAQSARPFSAPISLTSSPLPSCYLLQTPSLDMPGREKYAILQRAARAAAAQDRRVSRVESNLSEEVREILVASSDGRFARDVQPLMRFAVRVILNQNGKRQEGTSGGGGRVDLSYFHSRSPEFHAEEAVRQAISTLDAREAPAGTLEVVLAPGDGGILLHEAIGHGLEADFNRNKTSRFSDRMGTTVANSLCTVIDNATLPGSRGSINVDDEGNAGRSNVLIERGRLVGYMHDQRTSRHFGCEPTGNGRRASYTTTPMPRMTSTMMLAGPHAAEEIIGSVKRGIYAKKLGGGQVEISNGSFVFAITEGLLIEDGKLTAPLRGANLVGNGAEVLRRVSMVGNDQTMSDGIWSCAKQGQHVPVGVGCPTLKIDAITVGGTKLGQP